MPVKAKFKCTEKTENEAGHNVVLVPVMNGSEENKQYWKWTPSGRFEFICLNPAASEQFVVGKEYYIDISAAEV